MLHTTFHTPSDPLPGVNARHSATELSSAVDGKVSSQIVRPVTYFTPATDSTEASVGSKRFDPQADHENTGSVLILSGAKHRAEVSHGAQITDETRGTDSGHAACGSAAADCRGPADPAGVAPVSVHSRREQIGAADAGRVASIQFPEQFPDYYLATATHLDILRGDRDLAQTIARHRERALVDTLTMWQAATGSNRRRLAFAARVEIGRHRQAQADLTAARSRLWTHQMLLQAEADNRKHGVAHMFAEGV